MGVLVFAESDNGTYKKSAFESISYGRALADEMGTTCTALSVNGDSSIDLGNYGAQKVINVTSDEAQVYAAEKYAIIVSKAMEASGANVLVGAQTYSGKSLLPKVAVQLNASMAAGVISLPTIDGSDLKVNKSCFSNKAIGQVKMSNTNKVIAIVPNSYDIKETGDTASSESLTVDLSGVSGSKSLEIDKVQGKIPLTEAEVVVSAGRGLKGPENWGMVEEIAELIGGATACSKPVSDMDWRPHSEHVGQTGITIKPNLYIAIGISGAIQHLAGVGSSKTIVVINTDPEAPFFKAADFGIVGDAFEVVPKLINRIKAIKSA